MDTLRQDLRYAFRSLARTKAFTAVTIATLALGIGANTAVFTVINGLLLRPLAVVEPDRLVIFSRVKDTLPVSYPEYLDLRDRNTVFEGLAASTFAALAVGGAGDNRVVGAELVSGNYFQVMGVQPHHGRLIVPGDDRAAGESAVAVISHAAWKRLFGSADVVGQSISLNGHPFTLVGVAREGFTGAYPPAAMDVWVPVTMRPRLTGRVAEILHDRSWGFLAVIGRLRNGVDLQTAQSAIRVLDRQIQEAHAETDQRRTAPNVPWGGGEFTLVRLRATYMPGIREVVGTITGLIMGIVLLVLVIACANVANLLLARGVSRRREIATRLALGASRARIVRQLLTESLLLAMFGAGAGLIVASWTADLLVSFRPPVPGWGDVGFAPHLTVDGRVLGFTIALSVATALLFGLAPAMSAARAGIVPSLRADLPAGVGRRRPGLRSVLVVGQVAVSLVLVVVTGLFVSSAQRLQRTHPGFETHGSVVAALNLDQLIYTEERGRQFFQRLQEQAASIPGARMVSLASYLPFSAFWMPEETIAIEGREPPGGAAAPGIGSVTIDPSHLHTLGIALKRGRNFTVEDAHTAPPVVLVNEAMARRFWPDEDPLGRRIAIVVPIVHSWGVGQTPPRVYRRVVGIVADVRYQTLTEPPRPVMYLPFSQRYSESMYVVVRSDADPAAVAAALRERVRALDEHLPVTGLKTLAEHADVALGFPRLLARTVGSFGVLALLLAGVGLYGVITYWVGQRTREIGIRMALGADRPAILRLVLGEGMLLVIAGVALGVPLAIAARQILWRLLHTLTLVPSDPLLFAGLSLLMMTLGLLACYLPSRRATNVDPLLTLRAE